MKLYTISIRKIINGGYGLGRLDTGQIALIRHALPDETVKVTIEQKKKNYLYGKVQQIVVQNETRRNPPCKYYKDCGGCNLQHCDYSFQLTIKKEILKDLLSRQQDKRLKAATDLVADPIGSETEFGYRQRIRLQVTDLNTVGFHRYHSHEIIPINSCLLAETVINSTLFALRGNNYSQKLLQRSSELEILQNPQSNKTVCIYHFLQKPRPADKMAAETICREIESIETIYFSGTDFQQTGPFVATTPNNSDQHLTVNYPSINGKLPPLNLSWEVGSFCQVNLQQNQQLIEKVLDLSDVNKNDSVLDLFCGMGNFSIPLAHNAREVFGFEGQGAAIRSAKNNSTHAELSNIFFNKKPIDIACRELVQQGKQFDCIIVDPPRNGIPGCGQELARLTQKRLIYISCDPATLCRDLKDLLENGFSIQTIQPVDLFPQTHHIETVVLLTPTNSH